MYDIIKTRKYWFVLSGILVTASIIFLLIWGLKPGIDFTGGSLEEIKFQPVRPEAQQIKDVLKAKSLENFIVQPSGDNDFILRFESVSEDTHQDILSELKKIQVNGNSLEVEELRFESIGPTIGQELKKKAVQAIVLVLIFILLYIAYAFRKVSKPVASWKYGLAAIIALIHDILVVAGVFSVLGYFMKVEIDILFVTALLTILGFSVHDTIVTFDRIRENLFKIKDKTFIEIINISINETIVRSINTSMTTFFVLLAIFMFGGDTIRNFVLALILGIIIGTYSSIFIASPLLLVFQKKK